MKILYHDDNDGRNSGYITNKYFKEKGITPELIPVNYNLPIPQVEKDEQIVIVDFSLQIDEWVNLLNITKNIIWIDHHATAINKEGPQNELEGIRRVGPAGCELTWEYFYKSEPMPYFVRLVGDWDTWTFKYNPDTENFNSGLAIHNTHPASDIWKLLHEEDNENIEKPTLNQILETGKIIKLYQKNSSKEYIEAWGFKTTFEGYSAIAVNRGRASSKIFDDSEGNHNLMIPFIFDGNQWTVSLYTKSKDIDVGLLAKKYGGGGHKQASGFICNELPFKKE